MVLSIVILNYKTKNLAKELLKNLLALHLPFAYEIIVVDNASYDGIAELVQRDFPPVKFIQSQHNGGFAHGNNLGIKEARGKYVMICNPDLAFLTKAIEQMVQYMEEHAEVGLAGPRLINADKSIQYSCTDFPDWHLPIYRRTAFGESQAGQKWLDKYLLKDLDHKQNFFVPALFGACLIARKSAVDQVGLLDERYFMYMEDLDWSRRFWAKGYKVAYIGEAEVVHLHRRQSAADNLPKSIFSKSARNHIISFVKYLLKYRGQDLPKVS